MSRFCDKWVRHDRMPFVPDRAVGRERRGEPLRIAVVLLVLLGACVHPGAVRSGGAEAPDPRGLFFHAWTGSSAGTEWALVHRVGGGQYRLTDVLGNGFRFSVAEGGAMTVHDEGQGGSGSGLFPNGDEARFDWRNWGMHFSSRMARAPHTDPDFPILVGAAVLGDERSAGTWTAVVEEISPTTGAVLHGERASVRVTVAGSTFRLEWPDGSFDQGVFVGPDEVVFRVLAKAPRGPYATPAGCATSRAEDVIGRATIRDDSIVVDLFLQTRMPVGAQIQSQIRCELER